MEIQIPERPTIYDQLLLNLRPKDLIATFNWDPLISQAYKRNKDEFDLPPNRLSSWKYCSLLLSKPKAN